MPPSDFREKDRPSTPRDENLIIQIIDVMPLGVSCSVVFVSFFFFWGAAINLLKLIGALTGHALPALGTGVGALIGALSATLVAFILWKIKIRRK